LLDAGFPADIRLPRSPDKAQATVRSQALSGQGQPLHAQPFPRAGARPGIV